MVNTNKLKGIMAEKEITGKMLAEKMNISCNAFYRKMGKKKFNSDEMQVMVDVLEIRDPEKIFFAK